MSTQPAPLPPPLETQSKTPQMSEAARLAGVFVSPGETFVDIARRPRWWIPIILSAILSTIYLNAFTQRVGWESLIRQGLENSSQGQNMSPQQREQTITTLSKAYKYFGYGGAAVGTLFYVFLIAVVLMFLFDTLMSAGIGLKRLMAIAAYGSLPTIVQTALSMLVLFLKDPEDFDLRHPLMFNVGSWLSQDTPAALRTLGSSLDCFSLWIIVLLAIGVSSASRKIGFGKAFATIALRWALYVCLKTAAAAAGINVG